MKNNYKIIGAIIGALIIGFLVAWFIKPAGKGSPSENIDEHAGHDHAMVSSATESTEYTCSMHPQIRQDEPGICPICEMDLIPVEGNTSDDPLVLTMTPEAVKLANIQTTIVGTSSSDGRTKDIIMTGKVKSDETTASSLVAHVPGRIEKLYVSYTGERVNEGQKLLDIYSAELISAQQELLEAKSLQAVNPGLLNSAIAKLKNWKLSDDMISNILESGNIQEIFTFYAESSGIVSNRRIAVGDYIKKGEALFDLIDLNKVWVVFDAYEEDLSNIRKGDRIQFTAPALGERKYNTRVSFIDPIINADTRTAAIRTEVNNSSGRLKPEMFVNGILSKIEKSTGQSILVPKSAILWTGNRSVVYLKEDQEIPSFRYVEVVLGERVGDYYKIESGVEAGQEIVINGAFTIDAAAQLNNQTSMMNKNVGVKSSSSQNLIPDFQDETAEDFKEQLENLLDGYMELKDAMVETNSELGQSATIKLLEESGNIDMTLVKGDAHTFWMEKLAAIKAHGNKIIDSEDVEKQRKQFEFLSEQIIEAISAFGISEKSVYVQYCPMAFDNNGAEWLSYEDQIRNPYFGDKMLKCGIIQDTL